MRSLANHRARSKSRERRFARGTKAVLPRAVRPLAASALPQWLVASTNLCSAPALSSEEKVCLPAHSFLGGLKNSMFGKARVALGAVTACSVQIQALRGSAKPNTGRAATSFARGGGFGSLAGGATQRTMPAGSVLLGALPNHSINRTCPGKPGHAGYLKR